MNKPPPAPLIVTADLDKDVLVHECDTTETIVRAMNVVATFDQTGTSAFARAARLALIVHRL